MSRFLQCLLLAATAALAGRATQPAYVRPPMEAPTAWFNARPGTNPAQGGAASPERWWTMLNDPAINEPVHAAYIPSRVDEIDAALAAMKGDRAPVGKIVVQVGERAR